MINILKNLLKRENNEKIESVNDLQLLSGLMIEAANIDGNLDPKEISRISYSLINIFNENSDLVEIEIQRCLKELDDNKSLHFYTSKINKSFSDEKKITLIETLWLIILEDGKIHDFESNLIRRLSGLLYISDFQCGNAKKKALQNLQNNE